MGPPILQPTPADYILHLPGDIIPIVLAWDITAVIAGETAGEIDGMVVPTGAVVVVGMEAADIIVDGMEEDIVIGVDGGKS